MSVYKHLKYQSAIEEIVEAKRSVEKWTLRKLAEKVGIQPSYLTNVLKERFDFSSDQLFAVCEALEVTLSERKYLMLLLDHQRCAYRNRKQELKMEIDDVRRKAQSTERHISARAVSLSAEGVAEYYLDPFVQLAHVHLRLKPYDTQPDLLCEALGISKSHLNKILDVLSRVGYIERKAAKITVLGQSKHLPKENPLCDPHQALMRLKSIDQLSRLKNDEKYSFSVTLSGTDETRLQLQQEFLTFLNKAEGIVKPAEGKKAFQMNFDLFSWQI